MQPASCSKDSMLMASIAECMQNGMLPHVPEELSLEEHSLFPVKLHPLHATLERELFAWASTFGPRYAEEALNRIQIALLSCHFWPCSTDGRILTLLKLMYWLFVAENEVEYCDPASSAEEKALQADKATCRGVLEAMVQAAVNAAGGAPAHQLAAPPPGTSSLSPIVLAMAEEWWAEMRKDGMPLNQQTRLIAEVAKYLQSQKMERLLIRGPVPGLEMYIMLRRDTGAGGPLLMGAEYGLGIELDEEAVGDALILQLQDAAIDHAFWINDIYSFPREITKGECLNLLYVLHASNNSNSASTSDHLVPFHVAVSQAWQMVKARQEDCRRLAQQIALSPRLASKPSLLDYVEALCLITSGNWAWSSQVRRYKPLEQPFNPSLLDVHASSPAAAAAQEATATSCCALLPTGVLMNINKPYRHVYSTGARILRRRRLHTEAGSTLRVNPFRVSSRAARAPTPLGLSADHMISRVAPAHTFPYLLSAPGGAKLCSYV